MIPSAVTLFQCIAKQLYSDRHRHRTGSDTDTCPLYQYAAPDRFGASQKKKEI